MEAMFLEAESFNQNLGSWNVSGVNDMSDMLEDSGLSINNYDQTLIGWAGQSLQTGVELGAGGLNYCNATAAKVTLSSPPNNWTIFDDGQSCVVRLLLTAFLQGPYDSSTGLMNDDLRAGGNLPTTSPYPDALICNASVFNSGGSSGIGSAEDDIVDWVFVELRDESAPGNVVAARSALIQRDGDITDLNGLSRVIELPADPANDYYIAITTRNHLGVMTASRVSSN